MLQASMLDDLAFDLLPFQQDDVAASEVDVCGREIAQALVIAVVIVVRDEGLDLGLEIAGQVIVFQQNAVLQRLMPALDLALGHRVVRRASGVLYVLVVEPSGQVAGDVAWPTAPD